MKDSELHADVLLWRVRLAAACVGLTAVAFRQRPGSVVADTKLDLTLDPWGFMRDALNLWDPQGAFGQLQNQAYGYLFPMGPFHGLLSSAGISPWVTQRLWWSLLMCVAFLGMWRLTTELEVGTPWLRIVGGLAFALSPRIASELTVTSVEVWPMAVAPWVLVPLVQRGSRSWRWRISRSALAFAATGGVNAVASGAALLLPALWFLTRRASWRLVGAFAAWLCAVTVAMVWWLGPLILLGRYSPPFLDWIEGAGVTTSTASVFETVRGTSAWLAFLTSPIGPEWPGGWAYLTQPGVVVGTALLAGLGLAGLSLERLRERTFLALSLLAGIVLLGLGHAGVLGSPLALPIQELLDGPLAALRNTHKFDAVARVPLTISAVALLSAGTNRLRQVGAAPWVAPLTVVSLLLMITAPSVVAGLGRNESYTQVPPHWRQAARWLDSQPDRGSVLVLPSASFADYTWGSTKDDLLQSLMRRPFAVRDAVPLGSAGATRWLDGVQRDLGNGQGGHALASTLASAGVRFVVLRNDLRLDAQGDPAVAIVAGLERSGIERVAGFGPLTGNPGESPETTVDYRTLLARQSVEVYRVPGAAEALMGSLEDTPVVASGPEDLSFVTSETGSRLSLLGTDAASAEVRDHGPIVATDGLRRREVNFGETTHNTSQVLSASESVRQRRTVTEYDADPAAPRTTSSWDGIAGVRASSSASDANATLRLGPANGPGAALDGDPETRWVSGNYGRAVAEWLQVDLTSARDVSGVRIATSTKSPVAAAPAELLVTTEAGERRIVVGQDAAPVFVGLPPGQTRWVRVTLASARTGPQNGFAITELGLTGVIPSHLLTLPLSERPQSIALHADSGERPGCLDVGGHDYCSPRLSLGAEGPADLARQIPLRGGGTYTMSGTVRSRPSPGTDRFFDLGQRLVATASSRLVDSPADRPGAAIDRDLRTAWVAGTSDFKPTFTIRLPKPRKVSGLQFLRDSQLAASGAKTVRVTFGNGDVIHGEVDDAGYLTFEGRRTKSITVEFAETRPMEDIDSRSGAHSYVPVGFSELRVLGADDLRQPSALDASTGVPCGFGPTLTVNGKAYETRVEGTLNDVRRGLPMKWSMCGRDPIHLVGGVNEVRATPSGEFRPETLTLTSSTAPQPMANIVALSTSRTTPASLVVDLPARSSDALVVVPQNFNRGWVASVGQDVVKPIRVNGWMQGWVVPAGGSTILEASFEPNAPYRAALGAGGAMLLLLVAIAMTRPQSGRRVVTPEGVVMPRWLAIGVLTVVGLAVGGVGGLSIAIVAICAVLWVGPTARLALASASCLLLVVASAIVALDPWPVGRANLDSVTVQALSLAAVLLAAALALVQPARSTDQG